MDYRLLSEIDESVERQGIAGNYPRQEDALKYLYSSDKGLLDELADFDGGF